MTISDRPTADVILIIMAIVVALSVLLTGAGIFILIITHPEYNLSVAYSSMSGIITLFTGTILGYLTGKNRKSIENKAL